VKRQAAAVNYPLGKLVTLVANRRISTREPPRSATSASFFSKASAA